MVLNESQRRARFSNVLKWPSRRDKLPPTKYTSDQIQDRQFENPTLSRIEAQAEERLKGTDAGLAIVSAGPVPSTSAIQVCVWDLIAVEENVGLTGKNRTACVQKQEVNPPHIDSNQSCTNLNQLNEQIFSYRANEAPLSCCVNIITNDDIMPELHSTQHFESCNNQEVKKHENAVCHNDKNVETTFKDVHPKRKDQILMIDEIFETFVPAMRATEIPSHFFSKLVNLHRCNSKSTLTITKEDMTNHLNSLQSSYKMFAYSCKVFDNIFQADQIELLLRNSVLFVMVSKNICILLFILIPFK